jgi:hypothetical protein
MSIYNKPVSALSAADLAELLTEGAVENIRLEFKREVPARDETLKKLSSFANTFGGYLIIGAEASSADGRLQGLPGVQTESNYKQKIVQWCYDGASPPILPFVSDEIPTPGDNSKACYVIYVPLSSEAPHFLNNRKGAFVRTDEFSQRFEPRLATYAEIAHLANHRQAAVEKRDQLFQRSRDRFQVYANTIRTVGSLGATLSFMVSPLYPATPLVEQMELWRIIKDTRVSWRQVNFPRDKGIISQHQSALVLNAARGVSLFEISTYGHIHYAMELTGPDATPPWGIHLSSFVGHLLLYTEHVRAVYHTLGYQGVLRIELKLQRVRGKAWIYYQSSFPETGPASTLDDEIDIELDVDARRLEIERDEVVKELLRTTMFALNWSEVAMDDVAVSAAIEHGYEFNRWNLQQTATH